MYITQESDYAVRMVHCLAKSGVRRDARGISEEVAVSLRFSLKILGKLSQAGIVRSFKGNRGGYELARAPADISLRDVIGAVEGPYVFARCIHDGACSRGSCGCCAFQRAYSEISENINRQMEQVNFQRFLDSEEQEEACRCGDST